MRSLAYSQLKTKRHNPRLYPHVTELNRARAEFYLGRHCETLQTRIFECTSVSKRLNQPYRSSIDSIFPCCIPDIQIVEIALKPLNVSGKLLSRLSLQSTERGIYFGCETAFAGSAVVSFSADDFYSEKHKQYFGYSAFNALTRQSFSDISSC